MPAGAASSAAGNASVMASAVPVRRPPLTSALTALRVSSISPCAGRPSPRALPRSCLGIFTSGLQDCEMGPDGPSCGDLAE